MGIPFLILFCSKTSKSFLKIPITTQYFLLTFEWILDKKSTDANALAYSYRGGGIYENLVWKKGALTDQKSQNHLVS